MMQLNEDLLEIGAQNPLLSAATPEVRAALLGRGTLLSVEPGTAILAEGQPSRQAVFPISGKLQFSKTASSGRRQVFCYLEPGGCSGVCLLTMADHSLADIVAVEPSQVLLLPREALAEVSVMDRELGEEAWSAVMRCLTHFVTMVEKLSFHKVAERVAYALLDATDGSGGTVRRTQAELAAEVGTTREVVARCLADLQDGGVIKLGRGRIVVLDRERLAKPA